MESMEFTKARSGLSGELTVPGDKSISHRAVMFGSIAKGLTEIRGFLQGADCPLHHRLLPAHGRGHRQPGRPGAGTRKWHAGTEAPRRTADCGNSGTTMRLISGILAAQNFDVTLTGDASIQKRPMKRIIDPLSMMGADIASVNKTAARPCASRGRRHRHPLQLQGGLCPGEVRRLWPDSMPRAGQASPNWLSRNHTGDDNAPLRGRCKFLRRHGHDAPADELFGAKVAVPGDISSAAYFIAGALMVPGSQVLIKGVGINPPGRNLKVCRDMGADLELLNETTTAPSLPTFWCATLPPWNRGGGRGDPHPHDELPMIAAMACTAQGEPS